MDIMNWDTYIDHWVVVKRDNKPIATGILDKNKGAYIVLSGDSISFDGIECEYGEQIDKKYSLYFAYEIVDGDEITRVSPYEAYAIDMFMTSHKYLGWEKEALLNAASDAVAFIESYADRNDWKNIIKRDSKYLGRDIHIDDNISDTALMTLYRQTNID